MTKNIPLPLGLGHDICHIPRIYKILISKRGSRFIERVLTKQERQKPRPQLILKCVLARDMKDTNLNVNQSASIARQVATDTDAVAERDPAFWKAAEYMAGRFAAKEAAIKAFHQERLNFEDILIVNNVAVSREFPHTEDLQSPSHTTGEKDESPVSQEQQLSSGPPIAIIQVGGQSEMQSAMLSISHDGDYASAVCIYLPTHANLSR